MVKSIVNLAYVFSFTSFLQIFFYPRDYQMHDVIQPFDTLSPKEVASSIEYIGL